MLQRLDDDVAPAGVLGDHETLPSHPWNGDGVRAQVKGVPRRPSPRRLMDSHDQGMMRELEGAGPVVVQALIESRYDRDELDHQATVWLPAPH